jgi:hypothetical protein
VEGEDGLQAGGGAGGGAHLHTQPFTIREYSMIYIGTGFLAFSLPCKLDRLHIGRLRNRDNLLTGEGGGWGAESYARKKAWSSIIIQYFNT